MKERRFLLITSYIATIIVSIFVFTFVFNSSKSMNGYYIALFIPILIIFTILIITFSMKIIFQIIGLILGNNDNDEMLEKLDTINNKINEIVKYSLLIIFLILLTITMILDILLCIEKGKICLLILSIIIWLCLIYSIMQIIVLRK